MGKGSKPRPIPDRDKYESSWDRIFKGKDDGKKTKDASKAK